jgi:DNA-binding NarL/FixJ family response regulator
VVRLAWVCDDRRHELQPARPFVRVSGTVLIVDDHEGFRLSMRRMLEREGYVVVGEAVDGESAIAAAERLRPDIALVDVRLPGIDGFAVSIALRAAGSAGSILLISTRPRADHGVRLVNSGADGFIEKSELSARSIAAIVGSA